jgi:hypothetical protein
VHRLTGVFAVAIFAGTTLAASAAVQDDVAAATRSALRRDHVTSVRLDYLSVLGDWAYSTWEAGEGGGDSILRRSGSRWRVLDHGHGAMQKSLLVQGFGVPPEVAAALLSGSCPSTRGQRAAVTREWRTLLVQRFDRKGHHTDSTFRCSMRHSDR